MNYFIPIFGSESNLSSSPNIVEKLGGFPNRLPPNMCPVCAKCHQPLSLLAQFTHEDHRLNLGKKGRILFVFMCTNETDDFDVCDSWDAESGTNKCFIVEPENLVDTNDLASSKNSKPIQEMVIVGWEEQNDDIKEEEVEYFLNRRKHDSLDFSHFVNLVEKTIEKTKLGSVPYWIQYPEITSKHWSFVGQLDSDHGVEFGDFGIGYIFVEKLNTRSQIPMCKFVWQCG